jgi:hypothetical protein
MNRWRLDKLRGPRWIILLAPAVFMTLIAMAGSRVAGLFHDDSFFYAVVARNLAAGQGFSFDGVHATNGFHLLWVLVLGGINSVSPLRGMSGVMVMAALHLLLFAGVTFLYARILEKESVSPFNLSAFAISFLVCCGLADFGQESALYAMLLSSVMLLVWPWLNPRQQEKASAPRCTILCVAVAATVWSRLDAVVLIAFLGLYLLFVRRVRLFWCLAVASGLAMASLMFWNNTQLGPCATISTYQKAGFDTDKLKQLLNLGVSVRMGLSLALLVLAMFHALIQPEKKWLFRLLLFMTAGYVFYYGLLLSYVASLGSWYINVPLGLAIFLFCYALPPVGGSGLAGTRMRASALLVLALVGLGGYLFVRKAFIQGYAISAVEMGQYLATSPEVQGRTLYQVDGSGVVAYFSNARIINGDGLVNNFAYQRMVREGQTCAYLAQEQVEFFVTNRPADENGSVLEVIPLWQNGEQLPLFSADPEMALFTTTASGPVQRLYRAADVRLLCP